ncbi:MAG: hypothetical protein E3J72_03805 [Planctomycetota bacterium]|nr:MAG: hypothetical protein E3J72_03805 [Planctomycetota bacterium]
MKLDPNILRELSKKDLALQELRAIREEIPKKKRDRELIIENLKEKFIEQEESLKEKQKASDSSDLDLKDFEERINKLLIQRNLAKSNPEMAAFNHQIALLNEKKSTLETSILMGMEQVDKQLAEINETSNQVLKAEEDFIAFSEEVDGEYEKATRQLEAEEKACADLLESIDSDIVKQYQRILKHTGDTAIAEVEGNICLGCGMGVRAQTLNELLACNDVVICQTCQRILILSEEEAAKYC